MLSEQQLSTLAAAIAAETDPEFVALRDAGSTGLMAEWFNAEASPAYWVWRTVLSKRQVVSEVSPDNTSFSWTALINRSAAEQFGWAQVWNSTLECNPSLLNVRQAFADIFSGGTGAATRAHLLAMARRPATRGEKLFASGTGSKGAPALMGHEGDITDTDVVRAIHL